MKPRDDVVVHIIDDHPIVRAAVEAVVLHSSGLAFGKASATVEKFLESGAAPGGIVLLDLILPGLSGPDAVRRLVTRGYRVLMFSSSEQPSHLLDTLDAGASGYLSKSSDAVQLVWAVMHVADGSYYVAPHLAARLLEERRRAQPSSAIKSLTTREREVLTLVADGCTDLEAARELRIGVRTVRSHLDHIRTKTGRRRRAELTRLAMDEGLVATAPGQGATIAG
ncbi:MAG: response regulator [Phycicoccus sp.]